MNKNNKTIKICFLLRIGVCESVTKTLNGVIDALREKDNNYMISVGCVKKGDRLIESFSDVRYFYFGEPLFPFLFNNIYSFLKKKTKILWHLFNWLSFLITRIKLKWIIRDQDIIVIYHQGYINRLIGSRTFGKQLISWYHYEQIDNDTSEKLFKKYDAIVSLTKSNMKLLKKEWPSIPHNRFYVLEPALSNKTINLLNKSENKNLFGNHKIKILTIGHSDKVKGYDLIIETAKELIDNLDFCWIVIGGENNDKYVQMCNIYELGNRVQFLGRVDNPYDYIKSCDVFVSPSRMESYGIAINEALYLKKPVISTNTFGGLQQITNGINGILVDKNVSSLTNAILEFFTNTSFRVKIEKNISKSKPLLINDLKKDNIRHFFNVICDN